MICNKNKMKVIDLFCGCGGFSEGFNKNNNFEIVAAIDIWETAIKTYKKNHNHLALFMNFKEYIDYFKPKVFVMENVMGILSMKNEKMNYVLI